MIMLVNGLSLQDARHGLFLWSVLYCLNVSRIGVQGWLMGAYRYKWRYPFTYSGYLLLMQTYDTQDLHAPNPFIQSVLLIPR